MYKVEVDGYTFISESKDSDTVTVMGHGQNRVMQRDDAIALYKEHASRDRMNVYLRPQVRRVRTGITNPLRDK